MRKLLYILQNYVEVEDDGCWIWHGGHFTSGYACVGIDGKTRRAHRWVFEQLREEIPDGLTLDHLCRVVNCVNPDHLEVVTIRENLLRGNTFQARNAKKTHCPQGHPYNDENTYHYRGGRHCKKCKVLRNQRWRANR